ncbi:MAG: hypothetical protein DBX04_06965 [Candidatus Poseidoniales archaeon]|nr:MAG: hypothetical protein DBX04_06965 [Candidatus Poseidoniales archaeon]
MMPFCHGGEALACRTWASSMSRERTLQCPYENLQQLAEQSPLYEPAHMSTTMTGGGRTFDLHPLDSLLPHEEVIPSNLDTRLNKLVSRGFYKPILVDSVTKVILDGHHKWKAAKLLGLSRVPAIRIDYLNSSEISVDVWPDCGISSITKRDVVDMGLSESLYAPKTSRHSMTFKIPKLSIPLEFLRD